MMTTLNTPKSRFSSCLIDMNNSNMNGRLSSFKKYKELSQLTISKVNVMHNEHKHTKSYQMFQSPLIKLDDVNRTNKAHKNKSRFKKDNGVRQTLVGKFMDKFAQHKAKNDPKNNIFALADSFVHLKGQKTRNFSSFKNSTSTTQTKSGKLDIMINPMIK